MPLFPSKVVGFVIGALVLLGVGLGAALLRGARGPRQETLEEQLRSRRSALEALVRLINEDRVAGFCARGAEIDQLQSSAAAEPVAAQRLAEYRARLQEADVSCVWRIDDGQLRFRVWGFGFPGTEHARGFVWSRAPLPNEFPCLDSPTCFPEGFERQPREHVHTRIDPEWVVYAY